MSISRSTSWLVALLAGHDEVGVAVAHFGLPAAQPLQARLLDQAGGADAPRVLEDAAGVLVAGGLARLLDDPQLLHSLGELARIVLLQLELRAENHQLVEAALQVGEVAARRGGGRRSRPSG